MEECSESDSGPDKDSLELKYWRSTLIKDGLGPFLHPSKLKEKVGQLALRSGLSEACDPEALGLLMDTTEFYLRDFVSKVVQKARIRTQDAQPNLKQAQTGSLTLLRTEQY